MAETSEVKQSNEVNLNDVIKENSETIKTLVDQLTGSYTTSTQPTYVSGQKEEPPNYVLIIAIVAGLFLFFKKKGR